MRRTLVCAVVATACSAVSAQSVKVETFTLDNGMEFLLVPRHDQPDVIAAGWLARTGSSSERPGITGLSHFIEHMMFKGTSTIGTSDAKADASFNQQIADIGERLRALALTVQYKRWENGEIDNPWDPANDTPEMVALRDQLKKVMGQDRDVIVKDEFDQVYTTLGGSGMNAFTNEDLTFFFINVPSNKFELWAWMESDRLNGPSFREFYSERDVVHEERRLRTESTPTGKFDEQFNSMFWLSSPYNWPVVGWPTDLNSYTRGQIEQYFREYYSPNNLVGVVVGDFDPEYIKPTIEEYFGRLKRGPEPPKMVTLEVKQQAEMRMDAECDCQPQIEVRYHAVPFGNADSYALDMLSEILNGRTGRLYKAMVEGKEIASRAFAGLDARKYAGAFFFQAQTKGDAAPRQLESAWYDVLHDLQTNPVSDHELQKVKNRVLANSYRRLQNNFFLLIQLGVDEALGGWEHLNQDPTRLQQVSADDIKRVVNKYFDKTNRSVAIYTRTAGSAPEDPELLALDPELRQMARQSVARLNTINDLNMLRTRRAQMDAQSGQAPAKLQPLIKYIGKKLDERIAQLEAADSSN